MADEQARFEFEDGAQPVLRARGAWTVNTIASVDDALEHAFSAVRPEIRLDITDVSRLDTAGAFMLADAIHRLGAPAMDAALIGADADRAQLFQLVWRNMEHCSRADLARPSAFTALLERIGEGVEKSISDAYSLFAFLGRTLTVTLSSLATPHRIRWASTFHIMETAGVNALPIVAVLSFFVGAVVAYLGANLLQQFGAEVFAVELVGFAVLREFAVIITAILIAGRSDSAFTAQIGAMRMQQEIDAMQVMGLDIYRALVIPRVLACLVMLPLLTFAAMVTGIIGGMLVLWASLDISPAFFLARLGDQVSITQFWAGMAKAPVFAIIIAAIGCRQGLLVSNNVESLGYHVTSSVVQSIFAVIVIDAAFAMAYLELGI